MWCVCECECVCECVCMCVSVCVLGQTDGTWHDNLGSDTNNGT